MPRNPNQDLRNKILDFIKRKWLINGQQGFTCSLQEIAKDIDETRGEKIMHYINSLERGGFIKVVRGEGNRPNKYEFIEDNVVQEISQIKEKYNQKLEDFIGNMNGVLSDIVNFEAERVKEIQEMIGQLHYYKNELKSLEVTGYGVDGSITLKAPKNSSLPIILENILKEKQNNFEHQEMSDNTNNTN